MDIESCKRKNASSPYDNFVAAKGRGIRLINSKRSVKRFVHVEMA
jgi:hypothetical protein